MKWLKTLQRKRQKVNENPPQELESKPKYQTPRIMLLDLPAEISEALKSKGYNVSSGSLGTPYSVKQENVLFPVTKKSTLPRDYMEQDISNPILDNPSTQRQLWVTRE